MDTDDYFKRMLKSRLPISSKTKTKTSNIVGRPNIVWSTA